MDDKTIATGPQGSSSPRAFPRTDTGNAELFADLYGDLVHFDAAKGTWLMWRSHWWVPAGYGEIQQLAVEAARTRLEWSTSNANDYERQKEKGWAETSESLSKINACLNLAKGQKPIADSGPWDADPWLLGVQNGVLNLKTGEFRAGRPEDRVTKKAGVAFDPDAGSPSWRKFLEDVFSSNPGLIEFVQKAVGYSLTAQTTEQVFFICYGEGANGKSTFLETLRALAGDYSQNAPFSMLEMQYGNAATNDLARLEGRRLVTASENNDSTKLNPARLKALTGGDQVTARWLYQEFKDFTPSSKLWLAVNRKPQVEDDTYGFWRRPLLIPFDRQFKGSERDAHMLEKLRAELPGILNWAVEGCARWREEGLGVPPEVERATEQYRAETDTLQGFLDECCLIESALSTGASELRRAYEAWCQETGRSRLSNRVFVSRLTSRDGITRTRRAAGQVWTGIGLRDG